ncbi:MAG: HAD family hydrolase [Anaerolineae bacterium]
MLKCLLFDLDDTLLINDMDTFGPHYFASITARMKSLVPPDLFMRALMAGTRAMAKNDGSLGTNAQAFEDVFFGMVDRDRHEIMQAFDSFYEHEFWALQPLTQRDPAARRAVEWAFQNNLQVVIATQPMFPLRANEARLSWAGVGADEFHYAMITSFDTMRASKPHPLFFKDVLAKIKRNADECCMVGDSLEADMPARKFGLHTFWVQRDPARLAEKAAVDARGNLDDLVTWLKSGGCNGTKA